MNISGCVTTFIYHFGQSTNPFIRFSILFRCKKSSNEGQPRASTTRTSTSSVGIDHKEYRIAELKKTQVFEHSEQKRELEFLQAEVTRRRPEDARKEQFNHFLDETMDNFWKGQKKRETVSSRAREAGGVLLFKRGCEEWIVREVAAEARRGIRKGAGASSQGLRVVFAKSGST